MNVLSNEDALVRAQSFLSQQGEQWAREFRLMPETSFVHEGVFVIQFDSAKFLETGNSDDRLGGNMPIKVDLSDGSCSFSTLKEVYSFRQLGLIEG